MIGAMPSDRRVACLGGRPAFPAILEPLGPCHHDWPRVSDAFRGIFARAHFANHGPLATALDLGFARCMGIADAVCVVNGTLALMVLVKALGLRGEVVVPALGRPGTRSALEWSGVTAVPCKRSGRSVVISADEIRQVLSPRTCAIFAADLWGHSAETAELLALIRSSRLPLIIDGTHLARPPNLPPEERRLVHRFFSFREGEFVDSGEGGCIATDDRQVADKARTIRNFHPSHTFAPVSLRINAKMSEAQAAMALAAIDELPTTVDRARTQMRLLRDRLAGIGGIDVLSSDLSSQFVVAIDRQELGLDGTQLREVLRAENVVAYTGRSVVETSESVDVLQLPCNAGAAPDEIEALGDLLERIVAQRLRIRDRYLVQGPR